MQLPEKSTNLAHRQSRHEENLQPAKSSTQFVKKNKVWNLIPDMDS